MQQFRDFLRWPSCDNHAIETSSSKGMQEKEKGKKKKKKKKGSRSAVFQNHQTALQLSGSQNNPGKRSRAVFKSRNSSLLASRLARTVFVPQENHYEVEMAYLDGSLASCCPFKFDIISAASVSVAASNVRLMRMINPEYATRGRVTGHKQSGNGSVGTGVLAGREMGHPSEVAMSGGVLSERLAGAGRPPGSLGIG
jgi:hypothetical protein